MDVYMNENIAPTAAAPTKVGAWLVILYREPEIVLIVRVISFLRVAWYLIRKASLTNEPNLSGCQPDSWKIQDMVSCWTLFDLF